MLEFGNLSTLCNAEAWFMIEQPFGMPVMPEVHSSRNNVRGICPGSTAAQHSHNTNHLLSSFCHMHAYLAYCSSSMIVKPSLNRIPNTN